MSLTQTAAGLALHTSDHWPQLASDTPASRCKVLGKTRFLFSPNAGKSQYYINITCLSYDSLRPHHEK